MIQSEVDIKSWLARTPTVGEVRPAKCPTCKAPSCPVGGRIQLHGHGVRERDVCGPPGPGEKPERTTLTARRYLCVPCEAVIVVVPQGISGRRLYSVAAIAHALALWALVGLKAADVRLRVSPIVAVGFDTVTGWPTLRRWARAVGNRRLFPWVPSARPGATLREVAATAAAALAAAADATTRGLEMAARAFFGAVRAA